MITFEKMAICQLKNPLSTSQIAEATGLKFFGEEREVTSVGPFGEGGIGNLSFAKTCLEVMPEGVFVSGDSAISARFHSEKPRLDFIRNPSMD